MGRMNTSVIIVLSVLTIVLAFLGCLRGEKTAAKRLAKEVLQVEKTKKKSGIPRLLDLAGEKKSLTA